MVEGGHDCRAVQGGDSSVVKANHMKIDVYLERALLRVTLKKKMKKKKTKPKRHGDSNVGS